MGQTIETRDDAPAKPNRGGSDKQKRHLDRVRKPGRKQGQINKETKAKLNSTLKGLAVVIETGISPMEVMLKVMRGEPIPRFQYEAARDVAPYVHPKLNAVAYRDLTPKTDVIDVARCSDEELAVLRKITAGNRALPAPAQGAVIDGTAEEGGGGE